jgi:hypothetical protein
MRPEPVAAGGGLTGESLIPRHGTWGARPGPADGDELDGGGRDGGGLRADLAGGRAEPERAPAPRVRWNLSA